MVKKKKYIYIYIYIMIMIMIDEEKNSPQYHSKKHPNTRGPHLHMVTPLQIMKLTLIH
jgi:hypothetical protein